MSPPCSRNARLEKALVGRAQWGTHPGHPRDNIHERAWKNHLWSLAAAAPGTRRVSARQGWEGEMSGHFEHLASRSCATTIRKITVDYEQKFSLPQPVRE